MRVQGVVHRDVVPDPAMEPLAQLEPAAQEEVVVDLVVGRTIVQVHVPAVITAPAAVADDARLHRVQQRQLRQLAGRRVLQAPEAVAPPRVEGAVVAGLLDGIEHVAELDQVPAERALADVDAGARHVVDRAVPDGDALGHGDLHAGGLLLHLAGVPDQAVLHRAVRGKGIALRPRRPVDGRVLLALAVLKKRIADRFRPAHEGDRTGAGVVDVAARHAEAPVVAVHEDRVAAQLVELAVQHRAVLRAVEQQRATAVDRPVGAQQRLLGIHERAGRVAEHEALQGDESDRRRRGALELDQVAQPHHLDRRAREVHTGRRLVVEPVRLRVMEPLAGRIELFKDVLHHAQVLVHAHLAVVLPATLVGHVAVRLLARDAVVVAAPVRDMHGVDVAAGGVGPARRALLGERIRCMALVRRRGLVRIMVGITRHALALPVDEELVNGQPGRHVGLEDAVAIRGPGQRQLLAAADHRPALAIRPVDHRLARCARVGRGEDQRLGQVVDTVRHVHGDRLAPGDLARGVARGGQGLQRRRGRAGLIIAAIGCDVEVGGGERASHSEEREQREYALHGHLSLETRNVSTGLASRVNPRARCRTGAHLMQGAAIPRPGLMARGPRDRTVLHTARCHHPANRWSSRVYWW